MKKSKISEDRINKLNNAIKQNNLNIEVDVNSCVIINQSQFVKVKCHDCLESTDYTLKSIINGKFRCSSCTNKRYFKAILEDGYEIISRCKQKGQVRCLSCNHIFTAHIAATVNRDTKFRCTNCIKIKYKNISDNLGFDYLGSVGQKAKLRCRLDDHEFLVARGSLSLNFVSCPACQYRTYTTALSKKSCTLISSYTGKRSLRILRYTNADGDIFEAASGNVLNGRFTNTLVGNWNQGHSVYLIRLKLHGGDEYCKIGTANDIEVRAKDLKLSGDYEVFLIGKFDSRFIAYQVEFDLHTEFSEYRLPSNIAETFTGLVRSRKRSDGKYHRVKDGITEWFSSEVYETLKVRYNLT